MKRILLIGIATILSFHAGSQEFDPTFDADGWREDTINSGMSQAYHDVVIQGDNKVVVSGLYAVTNFVQNVSVVRYNADGTLDNTFGSNGKVYLALDAAGINDSRIAQSTTGETFIIGNRSYGGGLFYIVKLSQNGTPDNSFGVNGIIKDSIFSGTTAGSEYAKDITIQADGKILLAGSYWQTSPNTEYAAWVMRYNADGTRDNAFGTNGMVKIVGGDNSFSKLLIQPDGKILAGGCSGLIAQQQQDWLIARFKTDGTPDSTFGPGTGVQTIGMQYRENVTDMDLQSDGSIIIGGACGNGNVTFRIIKLTANGLNDANFGTDVTSSTNWGYTPVELQTFTDHRFAGLSVLPDDKIVIGGTVSNFKFAAIRFDANGDPDNTFGTNSVVDSMFIGADGISMSGAVYNGGTGRFYVVGAVLDGDAGITSSTVVAVKAGVPNSVKEVAVTKKLNIYPNPVSNVLHLEGTVGDIHVLDISGRTILSSNGSNIDVSQLSSGMYFIKCFSNNGTVYIGQFAKN